MISFTGIPDKLSFDKQLGTSVGQLPGTYLCQVYESADGKTWSEIWQHNAREEYKNGNTVQLQPSTQYVKFAYHGTVYCYYKNITVTERKEIVTSANTLTFPTADVDAPAKTLAVNVDWYNVRACAVTIEGEDADVFRLSDESGTIASALDEYGSKTLYVTYDYSRGGHHLRRRRNQDSRSASNSQ